MPEFTITDHDIRLSLSTSGAFVAGTAYFQDRRTQILDVDETGGELRIEAETQGSGRQWYTQAVRVYRRSDGVVRIEGGCSCPVGHNCKHVAAAVMQWRSLGTEAVAAALPPQVEAWLERVESVAKRVGESYPPELRQRLLYVLRQDPERQALFVSPMSVRLDKAGGVSGAGKVYDAANARSGAPAKYLRASDLDILNRIALWRIYGLGQDGYALKGNEGASVLGAIVATGRAMWDRVEGPSLGPGPARAGRASWRVGQDGSQTFSFALEALPEAVILPLAPPHYVDLQSGHVGRVQTDMPDALSATLLGAPALPPDAAEIAADRLSAALDGKLQALALPQPIPAAETTRPRPAPHLRLTLTEVLRDLEAPVSSGYSPYRAYGWGATLVELPVAELSFDYGVCRFAPGQAERTATRYEQGRLLRIERDLSAEAALAGRLGPMGLRKLADIKGLRAHGDNAGAFSFAADSAPEDFIGLILGHRSELEAEGWAVEIDPRFPLNLAAVDPVPSKFDLAPTSGRGSGIDWFDARLGVRIDGAEIDILPALAGLLRRLPDRGGLDGLRARLADPRLAGLMLLSLPDGRVAPISIERLLPILEALMAVWGPEEAGEGPLRLSTPAAAELAALQPGGDAGVVWSGSDRLMALAGELEGWRTREPTEVPEAFTATLRPYQQTGLDWLQMLKRTGFGGLLADDMGLGKTVQTLAHLAVEKDAGRLKGPALVVAPTSVLANWMAEAERFAPALNTLLLRGANRAEAFACIPQSDLVVTSYPLLVRDKVTLLAQTYSVVVFDEAQTLRNPATAVARAAWAVEADQRLGLSGTPVENHLGDLWSLMQALNPGLLGDAKTFTRAFRTPIEKRGDASAKLRLARRVRPFLLRRTKDEAAPDLPAKVEIKESVELTPGQTDLYEATRIAMQGRVRQALASKGLSRSAIVVLDALLKLRQVCCDPRLVKSAKSKGAGSAKLDRLLELVEQLRAEGRTALVFSQFTSMLKLIAAELDGRDVSYAWLTGDTDDRKTPIARFQSGEVSLFLISLKAGGTGLNLTAADAVILYDPWWNPAVEAQAIDRVHRIGRTGTVFVHRLIAEGTVEEKMLAMQEKKRELAAALWEGDGAGIAALTEADVQSLFD